jgi:alginate O-acetyltransferase complex protein AlgI
VVFSSVTFVFLFLPVVMLCHFALHPLLRDGVLLSASVLFYLAGEPSQFSVLGFSLLLNYAGGWLIGSLPAARR